MDYQYCLQQSSEGLIYVCINQWGRKEFGFGCRCDRALEKKETGDVYVMYEMIGFIAFSYCSVCMRRIYLNWFKYLCVILVKMCFINV